MAAVAGLGSRMIHHMSCNLSNCSPDSCMGTGTGCSRTDTCMGSYPGNAGMCRESGTDTDLDSSSMSIYTDNTLEMNMNRMKHIHRSLARRQWTVAAVPIQRGLSSI